MTVVRRLLTIFILSLVATALVAQQTTAPRTTEAISAATDRDVDDPRALRLTLTGALTTSLEQNLGVQLQTFETRIADQNLRSQYGLFDWIAAANIQQYKLVAPSTNEFEASGRDSISVGASVNQIIPTGGNYTIGIDSARTTSVGGGSRFNPQFGNGLDFRFNQPLLRDFGVDVTKRGITIARNNLGITEGQFRTVVMDTVSSVEQAYLDLIYARRAVGVVKESLFLARDQARITQIRIDVGASAPLDILQPRVTIATTEEQLIRAVASVRNAEDRLRALLNLPTSEWDRPIIPADDVTYEPLNIDFQQAVDRAVANRPETQQQAFTIANARVQAMYLRNQTLPTLDFIFNYGLAGVAGRSPVVDDNGVPTGRIQSDPYFDTFSQIAAFDFPEWTVGLNFGVPILNIGAKAQARAAELDVEQSEMSQAQIRQNIAVEVRTTARAVDEFAQTISATRTAREAAERNLEAERKRYENGMTTNFNVLEIQQQLSDARVRELQALVGYNKAVAAFHRSVGDILDVHSIALPGVERMEEPRLGTYLDQYNWLNHSSRQEKEGQPK
jgi:HAE1 family hydrophobic/amphiphilic exporter-1